MTRTGNVYKVSSDRFGNVTIARIHDGANAYLQGDDAVEVESQLDALDATAEKGYPIGPFASYEAHLDAVLDAYESILR